MRILRAVERAARIMQADVASRTTKGSG